MISSFQFFILFVYVSSPVSLPVYLSTCLPVCLSLFLLPCLPARLTSTDRATVFKRADLNRDGTIDEMEFYQALMGTICVDHMPNR